MKRFLAVAALMLAFIMPAQARIRGVADAPPTPGRAQLNIGAVAPAQFVNILKSAGLSFATATDAALLDSDGYLVGTPSGNLSFVSMSSNVIWSNVQYKMRFGSGVTARVSIASGITGCSVTGTTTVTSGCTGSGAVITNAGGDGTVTFTLPSGGISLFFPSGFTYARTGGEIAIYRLSDETDYLNGEIWTIEQRSVLQSIRSRTLRTMGLTNIGGTGNFNGESDWANRIRTTDLTWNASNGGKIPPRIYGGTISGTDTYTGAAAPSTPGTWTDGEQYIGVTTNANTGSAVTIDIGGRGAKSVVNKDVAALTTGCAVGSNACIRANTIGTFTYDALLDKVLYNSGGITAGIPYEAHINLANKTGAHLWSVLPAWATDDYVTNQAALVCRDLNSGLIPHFEYSNEIWNNSFSGTLWASQRGQALGWATGSNVAVYGWYGLRLRQVMGNLVPAACGGRSVRRVMAYQAAGDTTNRTSRFEGSQLCPGCSGANATYNSWTGSANYTAVGQRPIDVSEVLAYAPYASGANLCLAGDFNCTPTAANAPFYQCLVNAVEGASTAGCAATNPTVTSPTPVNLVDDDIRQGRTLVQTVTCSGTTCTTPLAHGFVAGTTDITLQASGGTLYSGAIAGMMYTVLATPTATTFTARAYSGGRPAGAAVDFGSAGTGTMTVGNAGVSSAASITYVTNRWEGFGEANAALYDATRGSLAALRVEQYEGNLEPVGLSAAQCTTLGITGSDCAGSIAAAILAWKQDNKASLTQQDFFNWFMGTDAAFAPTFGVMTHSQTPSQLVFPDSCTGNTVTWAPLLAGCLPNSGLSQVGQGYQAFSAN